MTKMRLAAAVAGAAASLALAVPAYAAATVTIDPQGEWSPGQADISGTARCDNSGQPGGDRGRLQVYVRDPATDLVRAYGTGFVVCDGAPHAWAVTAFGSTVQPGTVKVQAVLNTQTGSAADIRLVVLV